MKISVILEMLTANFETDAKRAQKALDKSVREMEQTAKRAGVAIGAGLASAATALGALGVQAINAADKLNDSSQRTGVMVEALSRLKYAAEQSGTSFEAVEKGLLKLSKEADAGGKNLARIGVTVQDAAGRMRPMNEILLDVSDRFSKMGNATEKAAAAQAIFGKAGAELIPMLSEGKAGLQALAEEAEKLGVVFSTDAAEAAAAFNDNLDKLKTAATGLGNDIATELLPALLDVTNAAIDFVKQIREDGTLQAWINGIKEAAGYIDELAVFIVTRLVAGALVSLVAALATTTTGFTLATAAANAFRLALALAGGPLGLLLTGIASAAVVIYNYEDAASVSSAANENLRKSIEDLNKATGDAIQPSMDLSAQRKAEAIETLKAAAANLKFAETQLAVANLNRDSDPTSNLEGMLAQDAAKRIKELGAEIETTKQLLVQYDAAQAGASERLREFKEEAAKAGAATVILGDSAEETARKAKLLEEALARAREEEERMVDWTRQLSDAADDARANLGDMAARLAADIGGPAVAAWQEYQRTLDEVTAELTRIRMAGPATADDLALAAKISDDAWTKYQRTLDEIAEQEAEAAKRADTVANRVAQAWEQAADQMAYAWGDLLTGQFRKFSDFAQAIKDIWLRAVADMIAASARSNIAGMLGNGSGAGIGAGGLASGVSGMAGSSVGGLLGGAGALLGGGLGTGLLASASIFSGAGLIGGITGSISAGVASIAGGAFAQGVGLLLGPVGLIVGAVSALVSVFGDNQETILRVRSNQFNGDRQARGVAESALGSIFVRGESLGDGAAVEVANRIKEFDNLIAGFLNAEQLVAVRQRLENVNDTFRDGAANVGEALDARFGAILGEMSADVQQFVGSAGELEDRVGRLAEALQIEGLVELGTLGDTFAEVAGLLEDYRSGTEDLALTYQRITASVDLFEAALALTGVAFDGTREELVRFAADITEAAGGLERAQALWSDYFTTFYSEQERAALALTQARSGAGEQFTDIGLDVADFTGADGAAAFRELFEQALPTLSAEAVVEWLEAANALGVLIEAAAAVTGTVPETADTLQELADFMRGIRDEIAELSPPADFAERMAAIRAETEALIVRATELGASEANIAEIRELGQLRINELLAEQVDLLQQQEQAAADLQAYLATLNAEAGGGITPLTSALQSLRSEYQEHINRINELAIASGRAGASQEELAVATEWYNAQVEALTQELIASATSIIARLYGAAGGSASASTGGGYSFSGDFAGVQQVADAVDDRYRREMQYLQQISDWLDSLNLSALSPLTPAERLAEAQSTYESLLARAQGGDLDALERLQGAAQAYLQESQSFTGGVGGYRDVFEGVQAALRGLVNRGALNQPGAETGNNGGGVNSGVTVEAGESFQQLSQLERFGLAQELTTVLRDLMGATGQGITSIADSLGLDLRAFVGDLGVDLSQLTTATAQQLAGIARNLGTELPELATAVGVGLGDLWDQNSLINDALEGTIESLPPNFRDQLQPLLEDIENATSEADANDAIRAAEAAINSMPAGIRDLLAPFFDGVSSPNFQLLGVTVEQAEDVAEILSILRDGDALLPSPPLGGGQSESVLAVAAGDKAMVESNVIDFAKAREEAEALRAEVARGNRMLASLLAEGNQTAQTIAARVGGGVAQSRSR